MEYIFSFVASFATQEVLKYTVLSSKKNFPFIYTVFQIPHLLGDSSILHNSFSERYHMASGSTRFGIGDR